MALPLGWLLWLLPNAQRRIASVNLRLCFPELSARQRRRLLRRTLCETAKTVLELGALWQRPGHQTLTLVREVRGENGWRDAVNNGRGALILTPHLGAWEIAGLYISRHYPLTALYRPSRQGAALDRLIRRARERLGGRYVPATAGGVRALYQTLRQNQIVGILPDQDPARDSGLYAPFFGQQAYTMVLVSRLAQKHRLPVFLIYAERLRWGRGYRLRFMPLPAAVTDASLEQSVAAVNQAVEQAVRRLPAQYLWSYKRFKTRPPGQPNPYSRP